MIEVDATTAVIRVCDHNIGNCRGPYSMYWSGAWTLWENAKPSSPGRKEGYGPAPEHRGWDMYLLECNSMLGLRCFFDFDVGESQKSRGTKDGPNIIGRCRWTPKACSTVYGIYLYLYLYVNLSIYIYM